MSAQLEQPAVISDADRETYIKHCGERMCECMAQWAEDNCFSTRGEAELWRIRMEEAIRGRSVEQVGRMEIDRGLT